MKKRYFKYQIAWDQTKIAPYCANAQHCCMKTRPQLDSNQKFNSDMKWKTEQ